VISANQSHYAVNAANAVRQFGGGFVYAAVKLAFQGEHRSVGAAIALHAHRVDGNKPAIGRKYGSGLYLGAEAADGEAWAWERMPFEKRGRQPQFCADLPNLIRIERAERLHDAAFQQQLLHAGHAVVMGLDGYSALGSAR